MPRLVIFLDDNGQTFSFQRSGRKRTGWDSHYRGNVVDVSEEDMARWDALEQTYWKLQDELEQLYAQRKRK